MCMKLCSVGFVVAGLAAVAGSIAFTQPDTKKHDAKQPDAKAPAGQPDMQLPPGMTMEDMQACQEAGTPGEWHTKMAKDVGTWTGQMKSWMTAEQKEPTLMETTAKNTMIMDGRYMQCEVKGDIPGMGAFHGVGTYAYDNVSKKLQATWIDSHSTGIMQGTGEASSDGSTLTWTYTYNCPITKKPTTMREVYRTVDENTKTMTMYGVDRKTGKEFKMMEQTLKRTGGKK